MKNLVDLHAHILPGLDDGPDNLQEALRMLKALEEMGFGTVFATPHHRLYSWDGIAPETVEKGVLDVSAAAARSKIGIKLLPGMEFDLDETLPERMSSVPGNGRHLLVDVGFWGVPRDLTMLIAKIMESGKRVVLVHPERNKELCRQHLELSNLIESGVRLLGNIGSLSGFYGTKVKRDAKKLLKEGYYWAFASDMHSFDQAPWIRDGIDVLISLAGRSAVEEMMAVRPRQMVKAMEDVR